MDRNCLQHKINVLTGLISRFAALTRDARACGLAELEKRRKRAQALLRCRRRRLVAQLEQGGNR
jgi:hypothetical protein